MPRRKFQVVAALLASLAAATIIGALVHEFSAANRPNTSLQARSDKRPPLTRSLRATYAALVATAVTEDAIRALARTSTEIGSAAKSESVSALREMLDSGLDAPTGLSFRIGPGGNLTAAPTFRVWMLDLLGRIDPNAAADYSAFVFARNKSADEWAIALRDTWRVSAPRGEIEIPRARALELLRNETWAREPSAGFLEALDLCVASLAWEAVPRFEQWLAPGQSQSLRAAAWIALDRLTMESPVDFLQKLSTRADWLGSQPGIRAGLMARANLDVVAERAAVETYLQRRDIAQSEGQRFFELLPNVSATVSHNLVTISRTPSPQFAALMDRAALNAVHEWREANSFIRWSDELRGAENRLRESVASAVRGGYLKP